jgi:hypothetical protein
MDPRQLFWDLLPRSIAAAPERFAPLRGVIAVSIQQEGADTVRYTVRLGDLYTPIAQGFDRKANLKLWFLGDAFARFLDGTLGPPTNRTLLVQGDPSLLEVFGELLSPPSSSLSVRFAR